MKKHTRRLGEGGCTAVLDCAGGFEDGERVGHPLHQAPEVLRARRDAPIVYTPAGARAVRLQPDFCHDVGRNAPFSMHGEAV